MAFANVADFHFRWIAQVYRRLIHFLTIDEFPSTQAYQNIDSIRLDIFDVASIINWGQCFLLLNNFA